MSPEVPIIVLILAIIVYFILRKLLRNRIKDSKHRNIAAVIGAIFLAPIFYLILVIAFFSYLFYEPQSDFNRQKWFADKESRAEMRDDIVESEMLTNKDKKQVIELIGKPDFDSLNIWKYNLGMSSAGLGVQFNSLELRFKNEKVSEVKKIEIMD